ncbi:MAG: sulfatase [Lacipirellulaceae bacterium]
MKPPDSRRRCVATPRTGAFRCALVAAAAVVLVLPVDALGDTTRAGVPKRPPNVVVILVDDLGWGATGAYGSESHETPNIDRLCRRGVRFTSAYSACTVCSPSRAALLSGCCPARLRLTDWIPGHDHPNAPLAVPDWEMQVSHDLVTLPEALRDKGYQTWFVGKWHLMPQYPARTAEETREAHAQHTPEAHGFDVNFGGREWGAPVGRGGYFAPFDMPGVEDASPGEYLTDRLTDEAVRLLESAGDEPFLLYVSHYTVHTPLMAKPDDIDYFLSKVGDPDDPAERRRAVYAAMHKSLDDSVGRVVAKLEQRGLSENTLVVFTSDNGGDWHNACGGLRGRKGTPFEGGVRVPLVVVWPGEAPPGAVCRTPVVGTDLYPTILDAAGAERAADQPLDGVSLLPLLHGEAGLERDALYWHYPHYHRATPYGSVRSGDWKLVEYYEDGRRLLFNLADDPSEREDLAAKLPSRADELNRMLIDWRADVDAQMPLPRTE